MSFLNKITTYMANCKAFTYYPRMGEHGFYFSDSTSWFKTPKYSFRN